MKKSVIIAIGVGLLVGILITGIYLLIRKSPPAPPPAVQQQEEKVTLLDWKDLNGFSFQYPEGIVIDKHDEDKENYAHIEMTHREHPGSLTVWAKDTTAADVAAWVKTEKTFRDASIVDTTLGGEPAKKILLSTPPKKLIIGTIFDEILWYIEAHDSDFWQKTLDTIVTTFTFTPLPGESSTGDEGYVEEVVDEEEVIE